MRSPITYLFLFVSTLILLSCTKSATHSGTNTTDTASIIGTWTWAYQSKKLWFDTSTSRYLTPGNTGISRTLIFDTSGKFTFIHNDSIFRDSTSFEPNYLQVAVPVLLLAAQQTETDTGLYQKSFGIVGCSFTDTTTLTVGFVPYQVILTADTLLIHMDPCLSRVVDIYVRK